MRGVFAELIFAYRVKKLGIRPEPRYNDKVEGLIVRTLKANEDDIGMLLYAIDGILRDPWPGRRQQSEFKIIFRDQEQVEKFAGLCPDYRAGKPHPIAVRYLAPADEGEANAGTP